MVNVSSSDDDLDSDDSEFESLLGKKTWRKDLFKLSRTPEQQLQIPRDCSADPFTLMQQHLIDLDLSQDSPRPDKPKVTSFNIFVLAIIGYHFVRNKQWVNIKIYFTRNKKLPM